MKEREVYMLKHLQQLTENQRRQYIRLCDDKFVEFLCECVLNIINGNVPVQSTTPFKKFENEMKSLCKRKTLSKGRRRTLSSAKGSKLLKTLYKPCADYLSAGNDKRRRIHLNSKTSIPQGAARRETNHSK